MAPHEQLGVLGLDRTRLVLLVIPAATANGPARALLSAAFRPDNALTADELVAAQTRHRLDHDQNDVALYRGDNEGGHLDRLNAADRRSFFL
ncbi:hypothetical protein ACWCPQ_31755 [Nocardia sp. NPDC001965]